MAVNIEDETLKDMANEQSENLLAITGKSLFTIYYKLVYTMHNL